MVGYIDVGGGMRAVYGAGVLDRLLDDNVKFPCYIGVSAGSANIISYIGEHRGRTLRFYRDYSYHKEYMGFDLWLKNKSYLNLDYIYSTLSDEGGLDPLNYDVIEKNESSFYAVTTDSVTGEPHYLDKNSVGRNDYFPLKASCCIPFFCTPSERDGIGHFDGGVSDPIPVRKAFELGCDKVVVTLTLPKNFRKKHKFPKWLYPIVVNKYPKVAVKMYEMIDKYNEDVEYINKLEKEGKVLILAPDDCCGVTTLKRTKEGIEKLYNKGYNDACKVKEFLLSQENRCE